MWRQSSCDILHAQWNMQTGPSFQDSCLAQTVTRIMINSAIVGLLRRLMIVPRNRLSLSLWLPVGDQLRSIRCVRVHKMKMSTSVTSTLSLSCSYFVNFLARLAERSADLAPVLFLLNLKLNSNLESLSFFGHSKHLQWILPPPNQINRKFLYAF